MIIILLLGLHKDFSLLVKLQRLKHQEMLACTSATELSTKVSFNSEKHIAALGVTLLKEKLPSHT